MWSRRKFLNAVGGGLAGLATAYGLKKAGDSIAASSGHTKPAAKKIGWCFESKIGSFVWKDKLYPVEALRIKYWVPTKEDSDKDPKERLGDLLGEISFRMTTKECDQFFPELQWGRGTVVRFALEGVGRFEIANLYSAGRCPRPWSDTATQQSVDILFSVLRLPDGYGNYLNWTKESEPFLRAEGLI